MAPGAIDELMMCRSGGASAESLQSWGAARYVMAPGSSLRLHDSTCMIHIGDGDRAKPFGDDETGRSLSEMETGRSLSEMETGRSLSEMETGRSLLEMMRL